MNPWLSFKLLKNLALTYLLNLNSIYACSGTIYSKVSCHQNMPRVRHLYLHCLEYMPLQPASFFLLLTQSYSSDQALYPQKPQL